MSAAAGHDRPVGLTDDIGVSEHAVVGVQLTALPQRDRVESPLGAGELYTVAVAERTARPEVGVHAVVSRR